MKDTMTKYEIITLVFSSFGMLAFCEKYWTKHVAKKEEKELYAYYTEKSEQMATSGRNAVTPILGTREHKLCEKLADRGRFVRAQILKTSQATHQFYVMPSSIKRPQV